MDDDDFDDLLGSGPTPADEDDDFELDDVDDTVPFASAGKDIRRSLSEAGAQRAIKGAPTAWFAAILGIGRTTVQRKIEQYGIAPKHINKVKSTKYYDPKDVLPVLVQPRDLKEMLAKLSPRDMPKELHGAYWKGRKAEMDVRENARDLWRSRDVHKAFGDLMKIVKDSVTLWTDNIDESVGMTSEQIAVLDDLARDLLANIGSAIEQYAKVGATRSQEREFDEEEPDGLS